MEKPEIGCQDYSQVLGNEFMAPHSNAFLDLNGDCAADIFITSLNSNNQIIFETWLREPESGKFCLVMIQELPSPNISLVTFGDMSNRFVEKNAYLIYLLDNRGVMDIVYAEIPEDIREPMNLRVVYNRIAPKEDQPCSLNSKMVSPFDPEGFTTKTSIEV